MKKLLVFALFLGACDQSGTTKDPTGQADKAGSIPPMGVIPGDLPEDGSIDQGAETDPNVIVENPFVEAGQESTSTFAIDVDTASYSLVRLSLNNGVLPDKSYVRAEEMINYFDYDYAAPALTDAHPFQAHVEVSAAPWKAPNRLVRIGLKAAEIAQEARPASNLTFLIDVSGSMGEENKLPLLKSSLAKLVSQLNANDRVSIVTYAGSSGVKLASTPGDQHAVILAAIEGLESNGSTNGESGIQLAYDQNSLGVIAGGVNRVILCTDGDFNVGQTSPDALVELIQQKAEGGIFLTVLGFGLYSNDVMMETLADKGNGNYAVIDNPSEADKVLVRTATGTLVTVAKDVKVQVEFNPAVVAKYRLIGYENRRMANDEFRDDKKDAGEIGAGHTVTALYEIELVAGADTNAQDLATLRTRYKKPAEETAVEMDTKVHDGGTALADTSNDFRFAAAAAGFAMILRDSQYKGDATPASIKELAQGSLGADLNQYRAEMVTLIDKAAVLLTQP